MDELYELTKIDKWFLYKLKDIVALEKTLSGYNKLEEIPDETLLLAKQGGFSDFQVR